jgi:UDP-N-acetylmuramoyl-L-alanyl-D-glutamate--2,6-diaminopimelate ligase
MGAIAERGADQVLLTSDNPRLEPPAQILAQIAAGMAGPAQVIENRGAAIAHALQAAAPEDVVLIAGKGHEDYQDVAGVKHPFSDAEVALRCLQGAPA